MVVDTVTEGLEEIRKHLTQHRMAEGFFKGIIGLENVANLVSVDQQFRV